MTDKELIAELTETLDKVLVAAVTGVLPGSLVDHALELIDTVNIGVHDDNADGILGEG